MTYKIRFSKDAERDLDELFEYIKTKLAAPKASFDMMTEIEQKIGLLAEQPLMFPLCHDSTLSLLGYRKLVIKNYIVIYLVNTEKQTLYIVRIFYGRRDYVNYIK